MLGLVELAGDHVLDVVFEWGVRAGALAVGRFQDPLGLYGTTTPPIISVEDTPGAYPYWRGAVACACRPASSPPRG